MKTKCSVILFFAISVLLITQITYASDELIMAITENDLYKTNSLLAEGADPNYETEGLTPLLVSLFNDADINLVDILISYGADLNWADEDGYSILIYALLSGSSENTIRLLLSRGASVNQVTNDGTSPLFISLIGERDINIIKLLLDVGANVNFADRDGVSPIMFAALLEKDEAKVNLLLDHGADVFQETEDGSNAFELIELNEALYETEVYRRIKNTIKQALNFTFPESLVPESTSFPSGEDDKIVTEETSAFYMAKYLVTYEFWKEIYDWATEGGRYIFWKEGQMGSDNNKEATPDHPATKMTWYDAVNWCNALTEYYNMRNNTNLEPVYYNNGEVIRDSRPNVIVNLTVDSNAKGFRLPTIKEWDLAARFQDGKTWTLKDHISGGAHVESAEVGDYAWFYSNSGRKTNPVGLKLPNFLDIYDMSGNVSEYCFDLYPGQTANNRTVRGGDHYSNSASLSLSKLMYISADAAIHSIAIRLVRTK